MAGLINWGTNFLSENVIKPVEEFTGVQLSEQSRSSGFTFHAKVPVRNPLCFPIPMGKFAYSMKTGGREITSGVIEDPGSLTARATTWLDVAVKIPFDILLSFIKDVADDFDLDYELEIRLFIDILCCTIPIPVRNSGTVKLPTISDLLQ